MAGRPTKINRELVDKIIRFVRAGNYIETASAAAGIHKDTFYAWLKAGSRLIHKGDDALKGLRGKDRDASALMMDLAAGIDQALAEAEARDLITIEKAAQGHKVEKRVVKKVGETIVEETITTESQFDWHAAAWRLERKYPGRWGRRERIEHSGPDGGPIKTEALPPNLKNLSPEEKLQLATLIRKSRAGSDS
jgi:hypothetical protein